MAGKVLTYAQTRARSVTERTRAILSDLPDAAADFIRAIEPTTQPLTRYAYVRDLRMFFVYLARENSRFSNADMIAWTDAQFTAVTARDIALYLDYLNLYVDENDVVIENHELGKMRKLATLRSFFGWMFKQSRVPADVSILIDMPKRHEKPILRLEIDEVAKLLDSAETGEMLSKGQQKYNQITKTRDLAILTLFLGTGIRVSELVGIDIDDIDFEVNSFIVTRKGGNQVILYFSDEVADALKVYLLERKQETPLPGHENALFLSLQNKRISVRAVEMMVKKYAQVAAPLKKRISPHKLRSTYGTNLYRETGDIYLVADVLGHSDVNTTKRHYAAMSEDRRRMASKYVFLRQDEPARTPVETDENDAREASHAPSDDGDTGESPKLSD